MRRITISVDDDLADAFDRLMRERNYGSRSEAFRDLVRGELSQVPSAKNKAKFSVGTLSYVYNHHERQLASRLMDMQHGHHDLNVSTMHVHLDHDNCIETVILRGPTAAVETFAQSVISQTGVRHGRFYAIPAEPRASNKQHKHLHTHPLT